MTDAPSRTCGRCHACCVHIKVDGLNKPAGVRCPHLKNGPGCCSIYDSRPQECGVFTCAWIDGYFPRGMRPDKSGILLEVSWIEEPRKFTILAGQETRPGAIEAAAQRIESSLPDSCVALIVPHDKGDPVVFGKQEDLDFLFAFMRSCQARGGIRHAMADGMFFQPLGGTGGPQLVQIEGIPK